MTLDPIDPTYMAVTPQAKTASDIKVLARRLAVLERKSLNVPGAAALAELEANRAAEWQTPTLLNGFTNHGGGYTPVAYYKDTFGRVYLRGTVSYSGVAPVVIFSLDEGYRPLYTHSFATPRAADVEVRADGDVVLMTLPSGATEVFLDQISFRTI